MSFPYDDRRVPYSVGKIRYDGSAGGLIQGLNAFTGATQGGSRNSSGTVAGVPGYIGASDGTSGTEGSVAGVIGFFGSLAADTSVSGAAAGVAGFSGAVSGVSSGVAAVTGAAQFSGRVTGQVAATGLVIGAEGNVGTVTGASGVGGSASGSPHLAGVVSADSVSAGLVNGAALLTPAGGVSGENTPSTGGVSGSPGLNGSSSGTSSAVGAVVPLRQSVTPDAPASGGYAWSFSGDSTPIPDVYGVVDGISRFVGSVAAGVIGHIGHIQVSTVIVGSVSGSSRIREQDDMEVLELLGIL